MEKNKCPPNKSYLCQIGACAKDSSQCPNTNGCPFVTPVKCDKAGTCAETNEKCNIIYQNTKLPNSCNLLTPFKCDDGSCAARQELCTKINICPP